jgi:hypothetical protein
MVEAMATGAGFNAQVYASDQGGMSFNAHTTSGTTQSYITAFGTERKYRAIVLQEQSRMLSWPAWAYRQKSVPYARVLYHQSKEYADSVVLYETWGYRYGDLSVWGEGANETYYTMQDRLRQGYTYTLYELLALRMSNTSLAEPQVAWVGNAWQEAMGMTRFERKLYDRDNQHPRVHGSYLAACVLYAKVFDSDPTRTRYKPRGISNRDAKKLRRIAKDISPINGED